MPPRAYRVLCIAGSFRGGSSRPLLVETEAGRFVLKLVGGPDGPRALAAEWWCTNLARALGLPTLELAALELDPALATSIDYDSELREAAERGAGLCLGLRELPGARAATPRELERAPDDFALPLLWLDLLTQNPDRRKANPNILVRGAALFPIDHGAALPFHHAFRVSEGSPAEDLAIAPEHVFADRSARLAERRDALTRLLPRALLEEIALGLPEPWLGEIVFETPERQKLAYSAYLWKRMRALTVAG